MERRTVLRGIGAAALAAPPFVRAQRDVKIGLTLPLSGLPRQDKPLVSYLAPDLALDFLAAFQAAVELERRGEPITVIALDDEFDSDKARANIEALVRQDVVAGSGVWTNEQARAVLPVLEANALPMIGLRSTTLELRRHPLLFHLRAGLDDETAAVVQTMKAAGYARWGVVMSDSAFGRAAFDTLKAQGAQLVHAASAHADGRGAGEAAREVVNAPGVQAVIVLGEGHVLAGAMAELRLRAHPFLAPVCGLSNVLTTALAATRQPVYAGFAVASPYPNPASSRAAVARRFVDAMAARELDHATRSFSAFEGFVYGSVLTRAIVGLRGAVKRESLAAALRGASFDLGGLAIAFDERQVGHRRVNLLYKSSVDWTLRT